MQDLSLDSAQASSGRAAAHSDAGTNNTLANFRASVKDFSSAAYCLSFVFHCLANLKCFPLAR